jgi:hypothetical protein
MTGDDQILLLDFVIYWLSLIFITWISKERVKAFIINFSIHIIYSSYMLYGLKLKQYPEGSGGITLGWLVFLLIILAIHSLLNIIIATTKLFKNIKSDMILDTKKIKSIYKDK